MPVNMTEFQAVNDKITWTEKIDKPMHYPWTFIIGLEANGNIIPDLPPYADDITSNRVHEVIARIPGTSNNSEIMLISDKILSVDMSGILVLL